MQKKLLVAFGVIPIRKKTIFYKTTLRYESVCNYWKYTTLPGVKYEIKGPYPLKYSSLATQLEIFSVQLSLMII